MRARPYIAGALGLLGIQTLIAGTVFRFVPSTATIAPIARVLDSLSPWLLASTLLISVLLLFMKSWGSGGLLALLAIAGAAHLFVDHRNTSLPLLDDQQADLRLLFFNALGENTGSAGKIADAVLALEPDIVVIAERDAVDPALETFRDAFAFVSPCEEDACELLVAARTKPKRFWQLNLNPGWGKRYAVAEFELAENRSVFVAASQIAKPWLSGLSEPELERLKAQYNWLKGPVIAVGDFNAAPWSYPMQQIFGETGMYGLRWPPSTWPAFTSALGVPIDQVLVRGGARVVRVETFGDGLGSNHLGFVADIAVR